MSHCPDCKQEIRIGGPKHDCWERRQREEKERLARTACSASSEKLAPCRIRDDGLPEFDGTRWESGMHLMGDMVMERLPEPCWIRNGRSAMKIDHGESRIMGRGIMLGYDVTEFSQNDEMTSRQK